MGVGRVVPSSHGPRVALGGAGWGGPRRRERDALNPPHHASTGEGGPWWLVLACGTTRASPSVPSRGILKRGHPWGWLAGTKIHCVVTRARVILFTRRGGCILSGGRRPNRAWCQPGRVPQMVRGGLPLACGGNLPWLPALGESDTFTRRPLVSVGCPN